MFRVDAGTATGTYCDGFSRRSFVQIGVAGMASVGLADILRAREESRLRTASPGERKDTSVILLWLDGGPSHLDLYDMKPDAPREYRGIWRPIPTNVSGIEISELFPLQAKCADKFSIVRSLHHGSGDHFTGGHHILTGRGGASGGDTAGKSPSIGSIATKVCGARRAGMPPYVSVPVASSIGIRPGYFGGNYLGVHHDPFQTGGDPNRRGFTVQNLATNGARSVERLSDRRELRARLDRLEREVETSGAFETLDRFQQQAFELVCGPAARRAFDIETEDSRVRDRYGRHTWGQSVLLARRLVEAGSTFVTVHFGGWDHHWNLEAGMNRHLPRVDRPVSALFEDLAATGLLERVLVVLCGEFSRTPKMNNGSGNGTPGRDHWGNAMFCLLGGGGVQGGRIVGATDARGERPVERPITPGDLHATIYRVLGVDPSLHFLDRSGRPRPAIDRGEVIDELF